MQNNVEQGKAAGHDKTINNTDRTLTKTKRH